MIFWEIMQTMFISLSVRELQSFKVLGVPLLRRGGLSIASPRSFLAVGFSLLSLTRTQTHF
jgi:hypothetical protein